MFSGLFAFAGRIMLALLFILSGAQKLTNLRGTGEFMASVGMLSSLALPAALFELIGGLCIALGIFTRAWAFLLAGFCLVTALLFHSNFADPMQITSALKNISIAGGFLCLFAYDQKGWSFDAFRQRRRDEAVRQSVDNNSVDEG